MSLTLCQKIMMGLTLPVLAACGSGESNDPGESNPEKSTAVKSVSVVTVTLEGIMEELEVQPVMCGLNRKGDGFTMIAGPNDGDDNARNNDRTLTVSGRRPNLMNGAPTSIRYLPRAPGMPEENVIVRGEGNPWIDGDRFEWIGETQSGKAMEVMIECP